MHTETLEKWQHDHDFAAIHVKGERRTKQVLVITAVTMLAEIVAGTAFGSMALLADGWHMGTHVAAFLITIFAYRYARRHQNNPLFTFGTGKVSVLGGFASAVALLVVAFVMAVESAQRFLHPQKILFDEAILVALLGLFVNVLCAFLLQGRHDHAHEHEHKHDHNLRAAYYHVLADALTSLLAIVALFCGKMFGWGWLDPIMGIVGAVVIARWSVSLLKETGPILLDENVKAERERAIKGKIESDSDNLVSDLHLWKVGPNDYAAIISLVTHFPKPAEHYKELLRDIPRLSHMTVEVNQCMDEPCLVPDSGSV